MDATYKERSRFNVKLWLEDWVDYALFTLGAYEVAGLAALLYQKATCPSYNNLPPKSERLSFSLDAPEVDDSGNVDRAKMNIGIGNNLPRGDDEMAQNDALPYYSLEATFSRMLESSNFTSGMIALLLVITLSYCVFNQIPIPELLSFAVASVIGYFFGTKKEAQRKRDQKELIDAYVHCPGPAHRD